MPNRLESVNFTRTKTYRPYHSPFDPCRPIGIKYYSTPPQLYIGFQPPNMNQFPPREALYKGTLWPAFWDYYDNPYEAQGRDPL
ncbi:spore coat associated protein CotJA [Mesobacillus foraminis]|uniref:spore coat associated protein CotJA n=1 Tax=Mesobacillus foraminis TaxID=279826 RepID=UPI001BE5161E|nr:spore coat associated protein CotJA [Mesobacillus foraminis]MBT2755343.1 spore coat associated protein CotJA [Mesobacillus foraminis]